MPAVRIGPRDSSAAPAGLFSGDLGRSRSRRIAARPPSSRTTRRGAPSRSAAGGGVDAAALALALGLGALVGRVDEDAASCGLRWHATTTTTTSARGLRRITANFLASPGAASMRSRKTQRARLCKRQTDLASAQVELLPGGAGWYCAAVE